MRGSLPRPQIMSANIPSMLPEAESRAVPKVEHPARPTLCHFEQPVELNNLRDLWSEHESHPNNDLDYFLLIARMRKEVIAPFVIGLKTNGISAASLAARIEHTRESFRLGYLPCGSVPVRKLTFVTNGIIGHLTAETAQLALQDLRASLTARGLDFAVLHNLAIDSPLAAALQTAVPAMLRDHGARQREHWRMSLPETFDLFLARRKKKHRYWLNRLPRVLEKAYPGTVETTVFEKGDIEQFCRDADAVGALTYQRKLGAGFSDVGESREYCRLLANRGALRGYILYLEGKPAAYWMASTHRDVLFLHSTGYDPQFRKYEVGTILFLSLIRDACGTVLRKIDFGLGTADYKERFGDEMWLEQDYYLFRNHPRGWLFNFLISGGQFADRFARALISQSGPIGRIKKWWRQRLVAAEPRAEAETP